MLPLAKRGNRLYVATSDPANLQALEEVRFKTNLVVEPVVVEDDKLAQTIARMVEASRRDAAATSPTWTTWRSTCQDGSPAPSSDEESAEVDDAPVVKYIQKILLDAISAGVSDIHFEPYEKYYRIRYRLDGVLMEVAQPPLAIKDKVASRIKVISKLDISEKRVPQDGRMKLVLSKTKAIDFRVSTLPTLFGEKIVMRILDSSGVKLGIEALGYDPDQQQLLLDGDRPALRHDPRHRPDRQRQDGLAVHLPQPPEPAGHQHLDGRRPGRNPAAGRQPGQRQRQGRASPSPPALRAFLRQDPDIIMVGEIRDLETADIAIKAAQTGHLVLSTLHTNDAPSTLIRLLEHGRGAVQRRLVGDHDHGAAAGAQAVRALQEARGHPARGAAARRVHARRTSTAPGSPTARSAATTARAPATRDGSASTRCCRSPTTCGR